jgi:hypothetical protein
MQTTTSTSIGSQSKTTTNAFITTSTSWTESTLAVITSLTDSTKCEIVFECQHNGEFNDEFCKCMCLPAFEGDCKYFK